MKSKWKLVYIDLFAGCGKCIIRDTEEEIDGSALIALGLKYPFNKYIFIDLNKVALDCLKERAKAYSLCKNISFKEGDCNQIIKKAIINNELPIKDHLYLALIDPTGLQINFD